MDQVNWIETCTRRTRELEPAASTTDAYRLAVSLWRDSGYMHPVAAAERRHDDFGQPWPKHVGIGPAV